MNPEVICFLLCLFMIGGVVFKSANHHSSVTDGTDFAILGVGTPRSQI
jgi:hypothetical protein